VYGGEWQGGLSQRKGRIGKRKEKGKRVITVGGVYARGRLKIDEDGKRWWHA